MTRSRRQATTTVKSHRRKAQRKAEAFGGVRTRGSRAVDYSHHPMVAFFLNDTYFAAIPSSPTDFECQEVLRGLEPFLEVEREQTLYTYTTKLERVRLPMGSTAEDFQAELTRLGREATCSPIVPDVETKITAKVRSGKDQELQDALEGGKLPFQVLKMASIDPKVAEIIAMRFVTHTPSEVVLRDVQPLTCFISGNRL